MAFGTSGVLGIELGSGQVRILHGDVSGHLLRVYDFAAEEILISNPENSAQQLEGLVERRRLRSFPAALTLSGPGVVHRLLDFPPMPLGELGAVVEREIRGGGNVGSEDAVFDWEVAEESESGNLKQLRVLVAIAPRPEVDTALELLRRCHLKPALFTTAPIALLRALRFVQHETIGLQAVLYMGGQQGYLVGVKDGAWSFYREFSSRASEKGEDTLLEEAAREANRALLYHRQREREVGEMGFLLCGEKGLEQLQVHLQSETGIHGEIVRPGPGLDVVPLGERARIFLDLFSSFIISLGLVAAVSAQPGINLAPKAVRKSVRWRPSIELSSFRWPAAALVLLLVFVVGHLMLTRTERHYEKSLRDRAALYAGWLPAIQSAEESRGLRESEKLVAESLGAGRIGEPGWIVLFKVLSRIVPSDLVLQSLGVLRDKDKGRWLVSLKGEVVASDAYAAQAAFNRFYQALKSSRYFEQIELLPLNVTTVREKIEGPDKKDQEGPAGQPAVGPTGAAEIRKSKIEFEFRGQAREA